MRYWFKSRERRREGVVEGDRGTVYAKALAEARSRHSVVTVLRDGQPSLIIFA